MASPAIGEILLSKHIITSTQLENALEFQRERGGRIGDILIGQHATGYLTLYGALAEHMNLPFVLLDEIPPDATLLTRNHLPDYIHQRAIPWKQEGDMLVIATSEPSEKLEKWARETLKQPFRFVMTSPLDIRKALEAEFAETLSEHSRFLLYSIAPSRSARYTVTGGQRLILTVGLLILTSLCVWMPWKMLAWVTVIFHLLYALSMAFKALIFSAGMSRGHHREALPDIPDAELPVYTILLPLYKEAATLPSLFSALKKLDYPADRLDIKLLLEEDDADTLAAARALRLPYYVDILVVPHSEPRTKPKACNYGLRFARGEFTTIYDAEDIPDARQLRDAVALFSISPPEIVCIQSKLNYYNARENLLTKWFAIEYGMLFGFMLKGLEAFNIPIPLGGTSNHFKTAKLRELGEWDPFNVTEDADLGVRLAAEGYRTRMLDSTTWEEAVMEVKPWIGQRSRWIKGYMQTWLVHMRTPIRLWHDIGWRGFWGLQFFVGLPCLVFLSAPIIWLLTLFIIAEYFWKFGAIWPEWLIYLALANLAAFLVLHWRHAAITTATLPHEEGDYLRAIQLFPLYWFLHCRASYKALRQLLVKPHFWEKTQHGVSQVFKAQDI